MYLHYTDESGTGLKDPKQNFFSLASLSVRVGDWYSLDEAVTQYKREWIPNSWLVRESSSGLLIMDSRSDLHTSVQDRRLVDAYRRYVTIRNIRPALVEVPLFGNSEFYSGLQLADLAVHIITLAFQRDYVHSTSKTPQTAEEVAYRAIYPRISTLVTLP